MEDELFLNEYGITNETTLYYMIKLNEEVEILMELKRYWNLNNNWSRDIHLSEWNGIEVHEGSDEKFIVKELNLYNNQLQGEIPIIGVGGIFSAEHAWEKLEAGADLVQIYSGLIYKGPALIREIVTRLQQKTVQAQSANFQQMLQLERNSAI